MTKKHRYPQQYGGTMPTEYDWWYLSFVSSKKGWLGACCIEGDSIQDAARAAHKAGCNPGGEVLGLALHKDAVIPEELKYKLVTDVSIIESLLGEVVKIRPEGRCVECEKESHG